MNKQPTHIIGVILVVACFAGLVTFTMTRTTDAANQQETGTQKMWEQDPQGPLQPGPKDAEEKRAPGKIDEDASREFQTTASGLKYRFLRKSDKAKPAATNEVEVDYKGWLDDGTVFDSSYRRPKSISFPLNGVIKGWTEGMQLIGEGGMIELEIPSDLGYGDRGTPGGPIPPKATLHFIVELIKIK